MGSCIGKSTLLNICARKIHQPAMQARKPNAPDAFFLIKKRNVRMGWNKMGQKNERKGVRRRREGLGKVGQKGDLK